MTDKHSANFLLAKKLYFIEKLKVKEVIISFQRRENNDITKSKIVFKGEPNQVIEGDEPDFKFFVVENKSPK